MRVGLDRILILSAEGEVFTVDPDGDNRVDLTNDAGPAFQHRQPVWSPTGERIAWATFDARDGSPKSAVVTSRPDGSDRTTASTSAPPFFLYWDPTGTRVAYLAPGPVELELGVVDVGAGGREATALAYGQPSFFSWRPDGGALFSHIGADELSYITLDGASTRLAEDAGIFAAPEWSQAIGAVIYAARDGTGQTLVLAEPPPGGARRELLRFEGAMRFTLNPDGTRLAYVTTAIGGSAGDGLVITFRGAGPALPGLAVLDLATGASRPISAGDVVAFIWNPGGDSLLYLLAEPRGGRPWLRWYVWDGHASLGLGTFLPTATFARDYLPFFDQYARALSLWSPDGLRFVYAGIDQEGVRGVWVQAADGAVPPILIADGEFASWSPR